MKFLSMYTPDQKRADVPPSKEHMAEMRKLIEDAMKTGALLATGMVMPISTGGACVRRSEGEITVIDGPFPKELSVGFALLEAKSKEEAIEMVRCFLKIAGDGVSALRQIIEPER